MAGDRVKLSSNFVFTTRRSPLECMSRCSNCLTFKFTCHCTSKVLKHNVMQRMRAESQGIRKRCSAIGIQLASMVLFTRARSPSHWSAHARAASSISQKRADSTCSGRKWQPSGRRWQRAEGDYWNGSYPAPFTERPSINRFQSARSLCFVSPYVRP